MLIRAITTALILTLVRAEAGDWSVYSEPLGLAYLTDERGGFSGAPFSSRIVAVNVDTKAQVWEYPGGGSLVGLRDGRLISSVDGENSGTEVLELDAASGAVLARTTLSAQRIVGRPVLLKSGAVLAWQRSFVDDQERLTSVPGGLELPKTGAGTIRRSDVVESAAGAEAVYFPPSPNFNAGALLFNAESGETTEYFPSLNFRGPVVASDAADAEGAYLFGSLGNGNGQIGVEKVAANLTGSSLWTWSATLGESTRIAKPFTLVYLGEGVVLLPLDLTVLDASPVVLNGQEISLAGGKSILLVFLSEDGDFLRAASKRPVGVADDEGWELTNDAFYFSESRGALILTGELPLNSSRLPVADQIDINDDLKALGIRA